MIAQKSAILAAIGNIQYLLVIGGRSQHFPKLLSRIALQGFQHAGCVYSCHTLAAEPAIHVIGAGSNHRLKFLFHAALQIGICRIEADYGNNRHKYPNQSGQQEKFLAQVHIHHP